MEAVVSTILGMVVAFITGATYSYIQHLRSEVEFWQQKAEMLEYDAKLWQTTAVKYRAAAIELGYPVVVASYRPYQPAKVGED